MKQESNSLYFDNQSTKTVVILRYDPHTPDLEQAMQTGIDIFKKSFPKFTVITLPKSISVEFVNMKV